MRTFQPQIPPQMSAVDQYPQSGMRMPQVDAIRRARSVAGQPLYSAAEEVMGQTKPAVEGVMKPYADPNARIGNVKPMAEQLSSTMGGLKPMQEGGGMTKPAVEPGVKPMYDPNARGAANSRLGMFGRTRPVGAAKPAPIMSPQIRELS